MSLFTKESLENLRKEVKLERVCDAIDMEASGTTLTYDCPFCSEEMSFTLSKIKNLYYCFNCEAKGDAIELLMNGWQQSFHNAVNFLSIMFNSQLDEIKKEDKEAEKEEKDTSALVEMVIKGMLLSSIQEEELRNALKNFKNNLKD